MIKTIKLDNGITIVFEKMPFVRSVAFGIFVKNGSRNENSQNNGISHFIEHLMFKGTKNRTAKQIADEIDSIGGQINAYTTKEYTCYYTRTLDSHFNTAFDVLSDMYFNSLFSDDDIKKERNVIIEEINMYEDSPEEVGYDSLQEEIWKGNSLSFPILGTEETISNFDSKFIKDYYKKHYRSDNTVVAIAGNFDREYVIEKIKESFGKIPKIDIIDVCEKPKYFKSIIRKEKDIEQLHLTMCFDGVPLGSDDTYALTAINTVFGGGMSSRLFQKIREENGLAYTVYSFTSSFINSGLFGIYAALNSSQLSQVNELIYKEISEFKKEKISPEQLAKTKEQIKSNFILSLENSSSRASNIGRNQVLLSRTREVDEIIKKVDDINVETINRLIDTVFDVDNMSISIVGRNVQNLTL